RQLLRVGGAHRRDARREAGAGLEGVEPPEVARERAGQVAGQSQPVQRLRHVGLALVLRVVHREHAGQVREPRGQVPAPRQHQGQVARVPVVGVDHVGLEGQARGHLRHRAREQGEAPRVVVVAVEAVPRERRVTDEGEPHAPGLQRPDTHVRPPTLERHGDVADPERARLAAEARVPRGDHEDVLPQRGRRGRQRARDVAQAPSLAVRCDLGGGEQDAHEQEIRPSGPIRTAVRRLRILPRALRGWDGPRADRPRSWRLMKRRWMIAGLVGLILATMAVYAQVSRDFAGEFLNTAAGRALIQSYGALKSGYLHDVDDETLIRGAIKGMIASLEDPYSSYVEPRAAARELQDLSGSFEGIGAVLTAQDRSTGKGVQVLTVYEGGPAA